MKEFENNLNGTGLRFGIVQSRFNSPVCEELLSACRAQLAKQGVRDEDITLATVPGALEIPLVLQHMAQTHKFDALIALCAVIRGIGTRPSAIADSSHLSNWRPSPHTGSPRS